MTASSSEFTDCPHLSTSCQFWDVVDNFCHLTCDTGFCECAEDELLDIRLNCSHWHQSLHFCFLESQSGLCPCSIGCLPEGWGE